MPKDKNKTLPTVVGFKDNDFNEKDFECKPKSEVKAFILKTINNLTAAQATMLQLLSYGINQDIDTIRISYDLVLNRALWDALIVDTCHESIAAILQNEVYVKGVHILSSGNNEDKLIKLISSWCPKEVYAINPAQTQELLGLTENPNGRKLYYVNCEES